MCACLCCVANDKKGTWKSCLSGQTVQIKTNPIYIATKTTSVCGLNQIWKNLISCGFLVSRQPEIQARYNLVCKKSDLGWHSEQVHRDSMLYTMTDKAVVWVIDFHRIPFGVKLS